MAHTSIPSGDPPSSPAGGALQFRWPDANGRLWTIDVTGQSVALRRDDESFDIPRSRWAQDVTVGPVSAGYVVRFCGPQRDVGFLVGAEGAVLARALGQEPSAPAQDVPSPAARVDRRPVLFPKMNRLTVLALLAAALAFVPIYGAVFALASIVLLLAGRRDLRPSRDYAHIRKMRRITMLWLGFNLLVFGLTTPQALERERPHRRRVAAAWMEPPRQTPPKLVYAVAAVVISLFSLSVHECAHAITALWNGDDHARSMGRVTLNPLSHIDPFGTVLLPAVLFFTTGMTFGYARPVPVIPSRMMYHRWSDIYVSAAGPVSNLLIASASMALYLLIGRIIALAWPDAVFWGYGWLHPFVEVGGLPAAAVMTATLRMLSLLVLMNVGLAFFNLLPIPPLDGSHVCANLYPRTMGRFYDAIAPFHTLIFIALLATGAMRMMLAPTMSTVVSGLQWMIRTGTGG